MRYLKWTMIGGAALALLAYLAGAGLVMFWGPAGPLGEVGPRSEGVWIFPGGYTDTFSRAFWTGDQEEPPEDAARDTVTLRRGPLDRHAGVFPLSLRYALNETGVVEAVDLLVTSDGDWLGNEAAEWEVVAGATLHQGGGWCVATVDIAQAPACACAYRVAVRRTDQEGDGSFSRTMPTAPTFLGRVYDRVAWWPVFRWLPDLR